jgi:hypothetical protein
VAHASVSNASSSAPPHAARDEEAHPVAICPLLMTSTYLKYLASSLLLMALSAACAEGEGDPEAADPNAPGGAGGASGAGAGGDAAGAGGDAAGAAGSAAGGSGGSAGGAGNGGAGASPGGAAGSTGGGGEAGSGGAPTLCDPLAPGACDYKCTLVGKQFSCDPEGTVGEGESCSADPVADNCAPGLLCVKGACARYCAIAADCSGDRTCSLVLDGPTPGSTFKVCEPKVNECDPGKQTGCGAGESCYPQTSGYKCDTPGSTLIGQDCTFASDCEAGASCFKLGGATRCYKLCDLTPESCGAGQKCSKRDETHGICTDLLPRPDARLTPPPPRARPDAAPGLWRQASAWINRARASSMARRAAS